jgi:hypothetical protein
MDQAIGGWFKYRTRLLKPPAVRWASFTIDQPVRSLPAAVLIPCQCGLYCLLPWGKQPNGKRWFETNDLMSEALREGEMHDTLLPQPGSAVRMGCSAAYEMHSAQVQLKRTGRFLWRDTSPYPGALRSCHSRICGLYGEKEPVDC